MAEHEGGAPQSAEIQEKAKTPELERISSERVGLTARLLLGGKFLNPDKVDIPEVERHQLSPLASKESASKLRNLSNNERQEYWAKQPEQNLERQKALWANQVTETLSKKLASGSDNDKARWRSVYQKLGIDGDITEGKMLELYDRFFIGPTKDSGISEFVQSVVLNYKNGETFDYDAITADLDKISWFANVFGENTSKILPSLFEATLARMDNSRLEELLTKTNTKDNNIIRVNRLTDEEKRLLTLLNSQESKEAVPPTPREPEKKPENVEKEAIPSGKDETEPKERKPAIVIPKEQVDALKKRKITVGEKEITYDDLVNQIIDIQTGKAKSNPPSLAAENNRIVQEYATLEDTLKEEIAKNKTLIISPAAWAMMDAIAQRSHGLNKELAFLLQTNKTTKETRNTFLAQYAVPMNDFSKAQEKHTVADMDFANDNLAVLSEKTELKPILNLQESFIIHTHQAPLGDKFIATPTPEDEVEIIQGLESKSPINWGILTKDTEGKLNLAVFSSNKDKQGRIHHNRVTVLSPDMKQLYKIPDNGFGKPWRPPTPKAA